MRTRRALARRRHASRVRLQSSPVFSYHSFVDVGMDPRSPRQLERQLNPGLRARFCGHGRPSPGPQPGRDLQLLRHADRPDCSDRATGGRRAFRLCSHCVMLPPAVFCDQRGDMVPALARALDAKYVEPALDIAGDCESER
jgi:hypothetical protein